jgi:leader peptidase (prepilin peptidase)/N-methyltransferase
MLLPIIIFASAVGAVFGVVIMIRQRKGKDTQIAFGPFLAIAGWIALICGNAVIERYLGLLAPA